MLQEVRELEKKLRLAPISLNVFGEEAIIRAKAIRAYLVGLKNIEPNKRKEKWHAS